MAFRKDYIHISHDNLPGLLSSPTASNAFLRCTPMTSPVSNLNPSIHTTQVLLFAHLNYNMLVHKDHLTYGLIYPLGQHRSSECRRNSVYGSVLFGVAACGGTSQKCFSYTTSIHNDRIMSCVEDKVCRYRKEKQ